MNSKDAVVALMATLIVGVLIALGIYSRIHATNVTNERQQKVQTDCIDHGNIWVAGSCLLPGSTAQNH